MSFGERKLWTVGGLLALAWLLVYGLYGQLGLSDSRPSAATVKEGSEEESDGPEIYPLVFPVLGEEVTLTDSFGDPRPGGRSHAGVDILAPKRTPVVAAADGVVVWIDRELGGDCCALAVEHDDGWRTRYIHLDNDTEGSDDGRGYGIRVGIDIGTRVRAGMVIGWVGDSGNAEETTSHLHFELRRPDRTAIDPYPSLVGVEP